MQGRYLGFGAAAGHNFREFTLKTICDDFSTVYYPLPNRITFAVYWPKFFEGRTDKPLYCSG
jgi:hypothetical protein